MHDKLFIILVLANMMVGILLVFNHSSFGFCIFAAIVLIISTLIHHFIRQSPRYPGKKTTRNFIPSLIFMMIYFAFGALLGYALKFMGLNIRLF
jgi:cytochrome b561